MTDRPFHGLVIMVILFLPLPGMIGYSSEDLVFLDKKICSVELVLRPIYEFSGELSWAYIVSSPTTFNTTIPILTDEEKGEPAMVELSLTLVPNPEIASLNESSVKVTSFSEFTVGEHKIYTVTAVAEVPLGSLAGLLEYWVADYAEVSVIESVEGLVVELRFTDLRRSSSYKWPGYESDSRVIVDSLAVRYLVKPGEGVYLLDGDERTYVGSLAPFLLYPLAFNPGFVAKALSENFKEWLGDLRSDPSPLQLAVERLLAATSEEEKLIVASEFAEKFFEDRILPAYSYLGGSCRLRPESSGVTTSCESGLNITAPKAILDFSRNRFSSTLGGEITKESLEKAIKESLVLKRIPGGLFPEPIYITRLKDVVGLKGLHTALASLLLPLPKDNPLNASMVFVDINSKGLLYPCGSFEEAAIEQAKRRLELEGESVDIEDYVVRVLDDYKIELVNKKDGSRIIMEFSSDINGTDGVLYLAGRSVAGLQALSEGAWLSAGPLLDEYSFNLRALIGTLVSRAASEGLEEALAWAEDRLESLNEEYSLLFKLAESWPDIEDLIGPIPTVTPGELVEETATTATETAMPMGEAPQAGTPRTPGVVTIPGGNGEAGRGLFYVLVAAISAAAAASLVYVLARRR